ncbi:MAG TPA: sugar ABC transporter permease [Candidatus Alectryocaccomicrobium excrementavium]|uniref:Sugar ABC transporter permease n=1 Tax=Candidatus Alectryocaccomicrobium excrementavium TaxID=2840668 RepID=A0A9D1K792_9FIRM|nr:sugar ABC transporter permease [Candidatus Alectryocaccomicrobium excrementavium]
MKTALPGALPAERQERFFPYFKRNWVLYMMVLPGLAVLIIFSYLPMSGIIMAFEKNYMPARGLMGSDWVGLEHFAKFFRSAFFERLMGNTLILGIESLIFSFSTPILFALLLNELRNVAFRRVTQTISYFPYFISTVIVIGLLKDMTSVNGGVVNLLIQKITGNTINFFSDPGWFRPLYIISGLWTGMGYNSIIYLAAISGINPEMYESALLDGANRFQQAVHITLPSISSTIVILLILAVGGIVGNDYQKILLMYSPLTYKTADVISTYVYREGILGGGYSYTTAIGLFNSLISLVLVLGTNWLARKISDTSIF